MAARHNNPQRWIRIFKYAVLTAFLLLALRLFTVQCIHHDRLYAQALSQHEIVQELPAPRGRIFDRNMHPIADSLHAESVWLYKPRLNSEKWGEAAVKFASVLGDSSAYYFNKIRNGPKYLRIARHIDRETAARLKELRIEAVDFSSDPIRFYPNGHAAAQVVGFCNPDSKGLEGLECQFDKYLKGRDGYRKMYRDACGRRISAPIEATVEPRPGYDVVLTIDLWVQSILEEEIRKACEKFGARSAIGIVLDIETSEVLAMASWPFFDPNRYGLYNRELYRNRAITDIFEPGSMAKAFTAAAAIDAGIMSPGTVINCEGGRYYLHGRWVKDAGHHSYHNLSLTEVIAKSSNVGAAKIGEALGKERLYDALRRFGFGTRSDIGLRGEESSWLYPTRKWSKKSVASISFGYEICVSAIALVRAYGAIAGDGTLPNPFLISRVTDNNGHTLPEFKRRDMEKKQSLKSETSRKIRRILRQVVLNGTCKKANIPEYAIAGKTGTAIKVVNGRYDWSKTVGSFIGFAPWNNPRLVVLVSLDEPKKAQYGGTVAGPAVTEVLRRTLQYLGVPPGTGHESK